MTPTPSDAPVLEVADLCTHFRAEGGVVKAVDGIDFTLRAGEVLGIVGESGSGKTVASLSVLGLVPVPPAFHPRGAIRYRGQELLGAPEEALRRIRGNRIAMIFQDPMSSLNPYLTVERQLTEVLELHRGLGRAEARVHALRMLDEVGIPDAGRRIDAYPHELSGGMRQRVMIAMALLCDPDVLIADEPTTALDVSIQAQILDLMRSLQKRSGTSVILITHDLGVIAGMADRVAVMYAGRIVETGTAEEIFGAPRHPYTRGLLDSIPRFERPRGEPLRSIEGLPPDLSRLPSGCSFRPRCPKATARCAESYPAREDLGGGRYAHCWHPEGAS
jgi:oligopeptide/dipeptide ABC transporter ATP-binding protein